MTVDQIVEMVEELGEAERLEVAARINRASEQYARQRMRELALEFSRLRSEHPIRTSVPTDSAADIREIREARHSQL
jgi:hypothetical protein